jgi:hypothetical protein
MKPTPFHLEWYALFLAQMSGQIRHVCLMAPKSHAKSTVIGKVIPLYATCVLNPELRMIGAGVNAALAERFLRANRRELESNELLIEDFGPFKPEMPEKWTQTELIVRRGSGSASPTWRAVGSGMPVQGGRADLIIGDDVADIDNSMTQLQRDRLQEWFDGDLMGTLEPTGHAFVIGTAKHNDDLYARLEKKSKQPGSGWAFRRYDAIVDEQAHRTMWPARWSWEGLMEKKADVGSVTFNRDFRNVAVNDETALFKMELLNRAKRHDLIFAASYGSKEGETDSVAAGIDLAIIENERDAQASDGDYTVNEVWRKMPNGKRRLLWAERRRGLGITAQVNVTEATLRRYKNLRIAIVEANQAQRWFASSLLSQSRGELPIQKHVTGRGVRVDVYEGIPSLVALLEADMIELPYGDEQSRAFVDIFVNELHGLGVEAHDDTVLSWWLTEIGWKKLNSSLVFGTLNTTRPA